MRALLLMRHAERFEIVPGEPGEQVPLTPKGRRDAHALGAALRHRLDRLVSSPVGRCVETAQRLARGARCEHHVETSPLLGAPGVFIHDSDLAWESFLRLQSHGVLRAQVGSPDPLPGFRDTRTATLRLLETLRPEGVTLAVTHDMVLGAVVGTLLGPDAVGRWPGFLETCALEPQGAGWRVTWRGSSVTL